MKYILFWLCPLFLLAQSTTEKPNVIILIADDLGYGDLSCYGEKTIHTPAVDALASQSLRFTNAHTTAATCTPSRYSLLTGLYNWRRNDTGIADGDAAMVIRPEQMTIADLFKSAGYTTAAIGKGFAIGSAALTALALFASYSQVAKLDSISLLDPLVIAGLLLAARDVVGGINWVQANKGAEGLSKLVEKGKSNFAGMKCIITPNY